MNWRHCWARMASTEPITAATAERAPRLRAMAHGDASGKDDPLRLDRLHRDILAPQLDAFISAAPDAAARAPYEALRAALDRLEIPPALAARLGAIAELAITSGRVRPRRGTSALGAISEDSAWPRDCGVGGGAEHGVETASRTIDRKPERDR